MAFEIVDKLLNGKAPWVRFVALGALIAGVYYDTKAEFREAERRLDAQWERMDQIDKRIDGVDRRFERDEARVETMWERQAQRGPVFERMIIQLDDFEKRLRRVERQERVGGSHD